MFYLNVVSAKKQFSLDKMCYDLNVDYPSDWRTESEKKNVQKRTNSDKCVPMWYLVFLEENVLMENKGFIV